MATTKQLKDELIQLLLKATEERSVHWEATADEDAFRLTSGLGNVRVLKCERVRPVLPAFCFWNTRFLLHHWPAGPYAYFAVASLMIFFISATISGCLSATLFCSPMS